MYKINKTKKQKTTQWKILFEFEKSKSTVEITHNENDIDLYLVSKTDGFKLETVS
jgi:hypothetical protein